VKALNKTIFIAMMVSLLYLPGKAAQATNIDPFDYFNVFSTGNIIYIASDFKGVAGAVGNVDMSHFSLAIMDQNPYALHAGGTVNYTQGTVWGSIEAAGNITLGNVGVYGDVNSGGTVSNTAGGNIYGNVNAQSITLDSHMPVSGSKNAGVSYTPYVDLGAVSSYFKDFSSDISKLAANNTYNNSYGALSANLISGVNVITIYSATLKSAYSFTVNGPADAILYINVPGTDVVLDSTNWYYNGGIAPSDVLLNYFNASSLDLSGGNTVNILAPHAHTNFSSGLVTGNLIVGDLDCGGQVNLGHFESEVPVPEPSTLILLSAGGLVFLLKRSVCKLF
jgi:choice-of-anchor A domain-containing protein